MNKLFNDGNSAIRKDTIKQKDWTGDYHSVCGCLGASNECKGEREPNDYYATCPEATEHLIHLETLNNNIWEPACGEGHISKVLENHGFNVTSTDLIDRGYGKGNINFLMTTRQFNGDIVTNPPYKFAEEFIRHSLDLVPVGNKVCMFLKVQFLEGKSRRKLFEEYPIKRVWVSSSRLRVGKNGVFSDSNMIAYAWYIWEKGFSGVTELHWFN